MPDIIKPIFIDEGDPEYDRYVCPKCNNVVFKDQKYCDECGQSFISNTNIDFAKCRKSVNALEDIICELLCDAKKPYELYTRDVGYEEHINNISSFITLIENMLGGKFNV